MDSGIATCDRGGRMALIEQSRDFKLVRLRPVLDRHVEKTVGDILRGDGISWSYGRGRCGRAFTSILAEAVNAFRARLMTGVRT